MLCIGTVKFWHNDLRWHNFVFDSIELWHRAEPWHNEVLCYNSYLACCLVLSQFGIWHNGTLAHWKTLSRCHRYIQSIFVTQFCFGTMLYFGTIELLYNVVLGQCVVLVYDQVLEPCLTSAQCCIGQNWALGQG